MDTAKYIHFFHNYTDPHQDYFEKQAEERKERVAKNEYKRLKNIGRTQKGGKIKGSVHQIV